MTSLILNKERNITLSLSDYDKNKPSTVYMNVSQGKMHIALVTVYYDTLTARNEHGSYDYVTMRVDCSPLHMTSFYKSQASLIAHVMQVLDESFNYGEHDTYHDLFHSHADLNAE